MKPELSQFPSKHFYDGKVLDGLNVVSHKYNFNGKLLVEGQNYCFLQVDGFEKQVRSGSFENYAEAQAVVKLVQQASRQMSGRWQSADRIRVICFYTAQVALIKRLLYKSRLSDVVVATVDSSQGSEADIVLVSFVRSRGHSKSVGFLTDDRRMNVAITRGKYIHPATLLFTFRKLLVFHIIFLWHPSKVPTRLRWECRKYESIVESKSPNSESPCTRCNGKKLHCLLTAQQRYFSTKAVDKNRIER